jgi:hypothetical protein
LPGRSAAKTDAVHTRLSAVPEIRDFSIDPSR